MQPTGIGLQYGVPWARLSALKSTPTELTQGLLHQGYTKRLRREESPSGGRGVLTERY